MKLKNLADQFNTELGHIYGEDEAYAIFLIAMEHVLNYKRADYLLKKDELIDGLQLTKLQNICFELQNGRPIQYVLGETVFYGLRFSVNESVLIPRPETEELVDWIITDARDREKTGEPVFKLIDIGTGSGCIAVTLKKNLPLATVHALDVSEAAIEMASANAALNEIDINFVTADIRTYTSRDKFDVVVSNPPYITLWEKEEMHQNVLAHEPHLALFVSNERPLVFYEAIADFAKENLNAGGWLYFEINEHLGKETIQMLNDKLFNNIELRKDMQGKDRMLKCSL